MQLREHQYAPNFDKASMLNAISENLLEICRLEPNNQQFSTLQEIINEIDNLVIERVSVQSYLKLESVYNRYLKHTELGKLLLAKILDKLDSFGLPIKIRFVYYYSLEFTTELRTQKLVNMLLGCYQMNLDLRKKLKIGFMCGLIYLEHVASTDSFFHFLNRLIVYLKAEVGDLYEHKILMEKQKSITIGNLNKKKVLKKKNNKIWAADMYDQRSKADKLPYFELLYRSYYIGGTKSNEEVKKGFYFDCLRKLREKLIRQYPGKFIRQNLDQIQNQVDSISFTLKDYNLNFKKDGFLLKKSTGFTIHSKADKRSISKKENSNLHQNLSKYQKRGESFFQKKSTAFNQSSNFANSWHPKNQTFHGQSLRKFQRQPQTPTHNKKELNEGVNSSFREPQANSETEKMMAKSSVVENRKLVKVDINQNLAQKWKATLQKGIKIRKRTMKKSQQEIVIAQSPPLSKSRNFKEQKVYQICINEEKRQEKLEISEQSQKQPTKRQEQSTPVTSTIVREQVQNILEDLQQNYQTEVLMNEQNEERCLELKIQQQAQKIELQLIMKEEQLQQSDQQVPNEELKQKKFSEFVQEQQKQQRAEQQIVFKEKESSVPQIQVSKLKGSFNAEKFGLGFHNLQVRIAFQKIRIAGQQHVGLTSSAIIVQEQCEIEQSCTRIDQMPVDMIPCSRKTIRSYQNLPLRFEKSGPRASFTVKDIQNENIICSQLQFDELSRSTQRQDSVKVETYQDPTQSKANKRVSEEVSNIFVEEMFDQAVMKLDDEHDSLFSQEKSSAEIYNIGPEIDDHDNKVQRIFKAMSQKKIVRPQEQNQSIKESKNCDRKTVQNQRQNPPAVVSQHSILSKISNLNKEKPKCKKVVKISCFVGEYQRGVAETTFENQFKPKLQVSSNEIKFILTDPVSNSKAHRIFTFPKMERACLLRGLEERAKKCLQQAIEKSEIRDPKQILSNINGQNLMPKIIEIHSRIASAESDVAYFIRFMHHVEDGIIISECQESILGQVKIPVNSEWQDIQFITKTLQKSDIKVSFEGSLTPFIVISGLWTVIDTMKVSLKDLQRSTKLQFSLEEQYQYRQVQIDGEKQQQLVRWMRISVKDSKKVVRFGEIDKFSRDKLKKNLSTIIGYYLDVKNGEWKFRQDNQNVLKILDFL